MIQPILGNIVLSNFQRQRVLQIGSVYPSRQLLFAPQLASTELWDKGPTEGLCVLTQCM